MGILLVYDVTDERSFNSTCRLSALLIHCVQLLTDIRTWHANIEQHASDGVNKILIGNKCDWVDKKAVTEEQGRELASELGIKFMETSAKVNEGVEEAFFTLARYVVHMEHLRGIAHVNLETPQRYQDATDRFPSFRCRRRQRRCRWQCQSEPARCSVLVNVLFINNKNGRMCGRVSHVVLTSYSPFPVVRGRIVLCCRSLVSSPPSTICIMHFIHDTRPANKLS